MSDDLAELGLVIDSTQVPAAISRLDDLAKSAEKVEGATNGMTNASKLGSVSLDEWNKRTERFRSSNVGATQSMKDMDAETRQLIKETRDLERETAKLNKETDKLTQGFVGVSEKSQVLSRALQVLPPAVGATVGQFQLLVASAASLGPAMLPVAVAAAALGVTFGAMWYDARQNAGDLIEDLNLTEKQMQRLKDSGVDTFITIGDYWGGFTDTIAERFSPQIDYVVGKFRSGMSTIADVIQTSWAYSVGIFKSGYDIIVDTWGLLPGAFLDITTQASNSVTATIEAMINKVIGGINSVKNLVSTGDLIDKVTLGRSSNPNAGKAANVGNIIKRDIANGMQYGREQVGGFFDDVGSAARERGLTRVFDAAGDPERAKKPKAAAKEARDPLEDIIAKGNAANSKVYADFDKEQEKLYDSGQKLVDQMEFTNSIRGKDALEVAKLTALHDLQRKGIEQGTVEWMRHGQAIYDNAVAYGTLNKEADEANRIAERFGDISDSVKSATASFAELFGTAGAGFAELINGQAEWIAAQSDAASKLADIRAQQGEDSDAYRDQVARNARANSDHELNSYGSIIGGVKGLFKEKSTAFKLMEATEKAYAAVRVAMALQEVLGIGVVTTARVAGAAAGVAADTTATGASVANSGIRAAADGVAAFAKTLASLPFPANLAAGAAVLAALVAVGGSIFGGKGGGASSGATAAPQAATDYTRQNSVYSTGDDSPSRADAGGYSIGREPRFVDNAPRSSTNVGNPTIAPSFQCNINGSGLNEEQLTRALNAHTEQTMPMIVQASRQAVANDQAKANKRQRIGGN